jgi:hypothetical protein
MPSGDSQVLMKPMSTQKSCGYHGQRSKVVCEPHGEVGHSVTKLEHCVVHGLVFPITPFSFRKAFSVVSPFAKKKKDSESI